MDRNREKLLNEYNWTHLGVQVMWGREQGTQLKVPIPHIIFVLIPGMSYSKTKGGTFSFRLTKLK
jgi:hypothetical protein